MTNWDWRIKLTLTILVDFAVIANMVWLLFHSKWAKPREERADKEDVR